MTGNETIHANRKYLHEKLTEGLPAALKRALPDNGTPMTLAEVDAFAATILTEVVRTIGIARMNPEHAQKELY